MATFRVSNQTQLNSAVDFAQGGDTILLASGTYRMLEMNVLKGAHANVRFGSKVTIESADPGRPAVINEMYLNGVTNLELRNVKLDYVPGLTGSTPFRMENVRNVTLNNADMEGHVSGAYAIGQGLTFKNSVNVDLVNSEIKQFLNAIRASNSTDVTISNNTFRGMAHDSIQVGGIVKGVFTGNDFRQMKSNPNAQHKDIIQFVTSSAEAPSRDILISKNTIDNGEVTHTFFFGNALARAGNLSASYKNVLIEDNYIRAAQVHGITIEHGNGVTIRGNTLIQNPDLGYRADVNTPLINVSNSSLYVAIQGNRVASLPDWNPTWTISGNVTGSRDMMHWEGSGATLRASASSSLSAASLSAATADALADTSDNDAGAAPARGAGVDRGGDQTFRLDGRSVDGQKTAAFTGVDFGLDDVIVFNHFDAGTFEAKRGGNGVDVWNSGAATKIDSVLDLRELVAHSDQLSASVSGDDLILRIAQDDGDVAVVRLDGLGDDYAAANHPELF